MQLRSEFAVPAPADEVFDILLDLEQVATCMPGASLTGHDGDEYRGTLKLKVGPIAAAYEGKVLIDEVDRESRSAVLKAAGRELNGQGGAEATIRASVHDNGGGSRVSVLTDVQISGKVAQFGRGALGEVTQRVMDQFAANLEARLVAGNAQVPADTGAPQVAGASPARMSEESLDVLSVIGVPMLRQAAPVLGGFLLGLLVGLVLRRGRREAYPYSPPAPYTWGPPPWTQPPAPPS
jgi:uncharacterized protein